MSKEIYVPNKVQEKAFCPFMATQPFSQLGEGGKVIGQGLTPIACMEIGCKFWSKKNEKCKIEILVNKALKFLDIQIPPEK